MNEERRDLNLSVEDQKKEGKVIPCLVHEKYSEAEVKPGDFLIHPYIPYGPSLNAIVGPSGTGKTFLGVEWLLTCSLGFKSWFGHPIHGNGKRLKVVYACSEGYFEAQKRIRAWLQEHGFKKEDLDGYFFLVDMEKFAESEGTVHLTEKSLKDLQKSLEKYVGKDIDCIMFDTLNGFCEVDENDNSKIGNFLDRVNAYLAEYFQTAIIFIHHTGKNGKGKEAEDLDPRGASSFFGKMDSIITVSGKIGTSMKVFNLKNRVEEEGTTDYIKGKAVDPIEDFPVNSNGEKARSLVIDWEANVSELKALRERDENEGKPILLDKVKKWKIIFENALRSEEVPYSAFFYCDEENEEIIHGFRLYSKDLEGYLLRNELKGKERQLSNWLGADPEKLVRMLESQGLLTVKKFAPKTYEYTLMDNPKYANRAGFWDTYGFPTVLGKFPRETSGD